MNYFILLFIVVLVSCVPSTKKVDKNSICISKVDHVRLNEGFIFSDQLGEKLWSKWNDIEFGILFVNKDHEFLINHSKPSKDFKKACKLKGLGQLYYRKRQFGENILASFPAVSNIPTVVIGTVEKTAPQSSTEWLAVLLHEHFHQLQNSLENYYPTVMKIRPEGDKSGGAWMLNYPFPYNKKSVVSTFDLMSDKLLKLKNKSDPNVFNEYLMAKKSLKKMVSHKDYAYMEFQIWQEGVARYIERKALALMVSNYKFSKKFRALEDFEDPEGVLNRAIDQDKKVLAERTISQSKRGMFYVLGSLEGQLLDDLNPGWVESYAKEPLKLELDYKVVK